MSDEAVFSISGFEPYNQAQIKVGNVWTSLMGLMNLLAQDVISQDEARKAIGLPSREEVTTVDAP